MSKNNDHLGLLTLASRLRCPVPAGLSVCMFNRDKFAGKTNLTCRAASSGGDLRHYQLNMILGLDTKVQSESDQAWYQSENLFDYWSGDESVGPWGTVLLGFADEGALVYVYCVGERAGEVWIYDEGLGTEFWVWDTNDCDIARVGMLTELVTQVLGELSDEGSHDEYRLRVSDLHASCRSSSIRFTKKLWKVHDGVDQSTMDQVYKLLDCNVPDEWMALMCESNGGQPVNPIINRRDFAKKLQESPSFMPALAEERYPLRLIRFFDVDTHVTDGCFLGRARWKFSNNVIRPLAQCSHNAKLGLVVRGPDTGRVCLSNLWSHHFDDSTPSVIVADSISSLVDSLEPYRHSDFPP